MPVEVPSSEEHAQLRLVAQTQEQSIVLLQRELEALTLTVGEARESIASLAAQLAAHLTEDQGPVWAPEFPGQPKPGTMFWGASVQGGNPAPFETESIGSPLPLFRSYFDGSDTAVKLQARASDDLSFGRLPLMSTKLPGSWAAVATGNYDAWLAERFTALGELESPVWLALHHEPRGDGPPVDWVLMQQRARKVLDDTGVTNVALVGILNGFSFSAGDADEYRHEPGTGVHAMGFDSYNPWFPGGRKPWKSVEDVFAPGVTIKESWGYDTFVGEFGVRDGHPTENASAWLAEAYEFGVSHGFVAMSYFNSGANSPDGPWTLTGDRLEVFVDGVYDTRTAHVD